MKINYKSCAIAELHLYFRMSTHISLHQDQRALFRIVTANPNPESLLVDSIVNLQFQKNMGGMSEYTFPFHRFLHAIAKRKVISEER